MAGTGNTLGFSGGHGTIRKVLFIGGEIRRVLRMSREIIFVEVPVQRARGQHEPGPGNVGPHCEGSVVLEIREFAQRILAQNTHFIKLR